MTTLHQFETVWPVDDWGSLNVLVAVSGGPDSVALLRLMCTAKQRHAADLPGKIIVAHFDHGIRSDSASDANWVDLLASSLELRFRVGRAESKLTSEQAARDFRYAFLEQTAAEEGARYITTGHTADDQAETILHHIVRGTGIAGLAGMPRARPLNPSVSIIRPLLQFRRQTLRDYLSQLPQAFLDDITNAENSYTRNRIRNELIPHISQQYNPDVVNALTRLGQLAAATQAEIAGIVQPLATECVHTPSPNRTIVDVGLLQGRSLHLVRELLVWIWKDRSWPLQDMSFEKLHQLAELAMTDATDSKPIELPGGIRAERQASQLLLTR